MSRERGQATVEYVAVALLVGAVMAAVVALADDGGIGGRVMAAFRRALCIVSGGPCDDVSRPCVRASRRHASGAQVHLAVLHLGGRAIELREQRADGTVAVTLVDEGTIGLDAGSGLEAHVRWGTQSWAAGSELRAAAIVSRASGRTWIVPDDAAAERLVDRVRLADRTRRPKASIAPTDSYSPYPPMAAEVHAPPPDETFSEHSAGVSLDAEVVGQRVNVHVAASQVQGERVERASGRRTVYLSSQGTGSGGVSLGATGVAGAGAAQERYGITFDRDGRPLDFEALSVTDASGTAALPPSLARIAGWLDIPLHAAAHVETEQHLDLTEPTAAAIVSTYLRAFGHAGAVGPAAGALRGLLEREGSTRVRTYVATGSAHEVGGQARVGGVGVGGEAGTEDASSRLLSAVAREPGQPWRPDADCTATA